MQLTAFKVPSCAAVVREIAVLLCHATRSVEHTHTQTHTQHNNRQTNIFSYSLSRILGSYRHDIWHVTSSEGQKCVLICKFSDCRIHRELCLRCPRVETVLRRVSAELGRYCKGFMVPVCGPELQTANITVEVL